MDHPILMSDALVRATLSGAKTQTRRLITPLPEPPFLPQQSWGPKGLEIAFGPANRREDGGPRWWRCPFGGVGDRLWVRETWAANVPGCEWQRGLSYRADHRDPRGDGPANPMRWRPSIHMPRWASRLTLEITEVRAQRLQDITEQDARAEGLPLNWTDGMPGWTEDAGWLTPAGLANAERGEDCNEGGCIGGARAYVFSAREALAAWWDHLNGERATWASNPWVWAITYRVVP